jgi:hypothetical protein
MFLAHTHCDACEVAGSNRITPKHAALSRRLSRAKIRLVGQEWRTLDVSVNLLHGCERFPIGYGAVCVTTPARARGARSARTWPYHAAATPGWTLVAVSWRRPSLSAAYKSRRRPDHGRPESGPEPGTRVAPRFGSGGSAGRLGGGVAPAVSGKRYHRVTQSWESRSWSAITTACTVATQAPHLYVATYEAMVNTKRVTPHLIRRMCIGDPSVHTGYT